MTRVDSLEGYVKRITETFREMTHRKNRLSDASVWYRGHRNTPGMRWSLLPFQYRKPEWSDLNAEDEAGLYLDYRRDAQHLTVDVPDYLDEWAWWSTMRHFGGPTRLLDWTESPMLALYFALNDEPSGEPLDDCDATVWLLDPISLNEVSSGDSMLIFPKRSEELLRDETGEVISDDKNFTHFYLPGNLEKRSERTQLPIAITPPLANRRIQAQRGCFTVHGRDRTSIEEIADTYESVKVRSVEIERSALKQIRNDLRIWVVETDVFPDLDRLTRRVIREWTTRPDGAPALPTSVP